MKNFIVKIVFPVFSVPTRTDTNLKQNYSNNFGNTHLGVGPKGIDGFILNIIFKPFVTRLIMMKEYLMSSENVALYGECRAFLTCIKENHGGIFRLVIFSSLLDPEKKLKAYQQQESNLKSKSKVLSRQDAVNQNGKGVSRIDRENDANKTFCRPSSRRHSFAICPMTPNWIDTKVTVSNCTPLGRKKRSPQRWRNRARVRN